MLGFIAFPEKKCVWIVGSSVIKRAIVYARGNYDGLNLGLQRRNATVWWQGKEGMTWGELYHRVRYLLTFEQTPDVLVIHCGGNSVGAIKLKKYRLEVRDTLSRLMRLLPNTKFVWSQILPRLVWRFSKDRVAMNRSAKRINNYASWICIQSGGGYIKYPELTHADWEMFGADGVHLSDMATRIFLHRLQSFLFEFLSSD